MQPGDGPGRGLTAPLVRATGTVLGAGTLLLLGLASLELPVLGGDARLFWAMVLGNVTASLACVFALALLVRASSETAARALSVVLVSTALLYALTIGPLALFGRAAGAFLASQEPAVTWFWAAISLLFAFAGVGLVRFAAFFPEPVTEEALAVARDLGEDVVDEVPTLLRIPAKTTWWLRRLARKLPRSLRISDDPAGASFRFMRRALRLIRSPGFWLLAPAVGLAAVAWRWSLLLLSVLIVLVVFPVAADLIGTSYVASDPPERRKILWLTAGIFPCALLLSGGLGMSVAVVESVLTGGLQSSWNLTRLLLLVSPAGLILMGGLAAAIFLHGALDPALAIRRTALYGFLGVALAFLFAVVENALSDWVLSGFGLPPGAAAWMAGGFLALTVVPLHRWTRTGVDRLLEERLPDVGEPLIRDRDAVLVEAALRAPASSDDGDDDVLEAQSMVVRAAGRKIANGRDGVATARARANGILLVLAAPEGAVQVARTLGRNVRAACEALDLPTPALRLAVHRGPVRVEEDRVVGSAAESLRAAGAEAADGQILLTSAAFAGRPPDDELEGLHLEPAGTLDSATAEEPLRLWRAIETASV